MKESNVIGLIPKKYANAVPYSKYAQMANGVPGGNIDCVILGNKDVNTMLLEASEAINMEIAKDGK